MNQSELSLGQILDIPQAVLKETTFKLIKARGEEDDTHLKIKKIRMGLQRVLL